jgi:hypothetical protein
MRIELQWVLVTPSSGLGIRRRLCKIWIALYIDIINQVPQVATTQVLIRLPDALVRRRLSITDLRTIAEGVRRILEL